MQYRVVPSLKLLVTGNVRHNDLIDPVLIKGATVPVAIATNDMLRGSKVNVV